MKRPKCPECGSDNVILTIEVPNVPFYISDDGEVDFEERDIRMAIYDAMNGDFAECECNDCGESWDYDDDD